jgi:hypothetical protein
VSLVAGRKAARRKQKLDDLFNAADKVSKQSLFLKAFSPHRRLGSLHRFTTSNGAQMEQLLLAQKRVLGKVICVAFLHVECSPQCILRRQFVSSSWLKV